MALMISDLPEDLLREIVCRVALTDMRAVRLTCKKWDTLSKSGSFRKMHMCNESVRAEGETRLVALMGNNLHLIDVVVDDIDVPSTEIKGKLSCLDQQQLNIIKVFHCQGLLLCVLRDSFRLVVWNPYLGHIRWIEPPSYSRHGRPRGRDRYRYALGYDHNKKSHKILRFLDDKNKEGHVSCYEIYDFHSNLWRTLNVSIPDGWLVPFFEIGIPLNGNTYWLTRLERPVFSIYDRVVGFDFTSEKFGPILPLPFNPEDGRRNRAVLSCLKGDKLAVCLQFLQPSEFEIWVTSVIDPTKVSWSKILAVDTGPLIDRRYGFSSMGLFVDEEKNVAMVFDKPSHTRHTLNILGEAGFFRQVYVDLPIDRSHRHSPDYTPLCSHYLPSLVQIQKPLLRVYKRRKQPTKLRLRQCDRNKSRLNDDDDDDEDHLPKRTRRT